MRTKSLVAILVVAFWIALPRFAKACDLRSASFTFNSNSGSGNSTSNLRRLAQDALKAAREKDRTKLVEITSSMVLPNADQWFSRVFGAHTGNVLGQDYSGTARQVPGFLAGLFSSLAAEGITETTVRTFTKSCDHAADENEYPSLALRGRDEPPNELRFTDSKISKALRYFAFVDGTYRFVGQLDVRDIVNLLNRSDIPALPVAEKDIASRLVERSTVEYPLDAVLQRLQGRVQLHVRIGVDGRVREIQVLRGICLFAEPAVRAVKQYRYSPTLVNNAPVEVDTTLEVLFKLGG